MMSDPGFVGILMFPVVVALLMLGFPVAFTLSGVALAFAGFGDAMGLFHTEMLGGIPSRIYGIMTNPLYVAVPLFVFMGAILERSKIAEDLLITIGLLFGSVAGGLGIAVILVGAVLAASTGVVGATVVTMGLISLPAMLRAGYDPRLASGIICSAGTLGQIIPPSIVLVLLADMLQGAYTEAQSKVGNFAPQSFSVVDFFVGAIIPGLLLVLLYCGWIVTIAIRQPKNCPPLVEKGTARPKLVRRVLKALVPPVLLMIAVLGSIITGMATATESAAIGAVGALALAAAHGQLTWAVLQSAMRSTMETTSMIFVILIGASIFSLVFRGYGGDALVEHFLTGLPGGAVGGMLFIMLVIFLLGFVLDFIEIMFLVIPIVGPVILMYPEVTPIWFGVMIAVNLQTSFLTPPFGFSLFYLRGVAPASVTTLHIYRGVLPFVLLQLVGLGILWAFPPLITWLPAMLK